MTPSRSFVVSLFSGSLACVLGALACGGGQSLPPVRVRASGLADLPPVREGQPVIIELDEGDVIPLAVKVDGDLAATPADAAPIPIRVKRHFFLKIDGASIRASRDGVTFGEHKTPGSFAFAFDVKRDTGMRAEMRIVTPTP